MTSFQNDKKASWIIPSGVEYFLFFCQLNIILIKDDRVELEECTWGRFIGVVVSLLINHSW